MTAGAESFNGRAFSRVAVIGGGAWGTALAALLCRNGPEVTLFAREEAVVEAIRDRRENTLFLPGVELPAKLAATGSLAEAARGAEAVVFAAPAQHTRAVAALLRPSAAAEAPVLLCAKGVEQASGMMMSEVLGEVWPQARLAVLSGPCFARDVARGLPTAATLAATDAELARRWQASLTAQHFRPYLSDDLVGAQLGGAVKNVLAIAAGAVEGAGLGESARAALIARGFAEFTRLGVAAGARPETMAGLSGLGDLVLTATSPQSRNMSLGLMLGRGRRAADVLAERASVAEGAATAPALLSLARRLGVEMPICAAVADLVSGARAIDAAIADLLARPVGREH